MDIEEAKEILQTCAQSLLSIRNNLELEIPPSMAPITTNFFFDQLECAMENIECRDYDLERLIKSKSEITDLEVLIDNAYGKYLENKRAKEAVETIRVQKVIKERIEAFSARLHEVIPDDIYNALNLEVLCKSENSPVGALFTYRQAKILITWGPYAGGEWGIEVGQGKISEQMEHVRSEKLVNRLLLKMAFIKERANADIYR